jgi:tRNA(Ile)-lysidine synthase
MQPKFENKLASFIEVHDLFGSASKVVLAVSGGADSMALLYGMQALKAEYILKTTFVCAHINHQLRGAEADSDEKFVIAEAAQLKLNVATKRVDVRGFARDHKLSIETAARQCRLTALMEIAKTNHCERIATAHQKNDNAETILHRLVRGTGFRGLSGIWPKRLFAGGVTLIRPMLCVTRDEVIEYLQSRNLTWRRDRTNTDCTYKRNFIRHRLLPVLQRDCSDTLVETLSGLSRSALGFYNRVCERAEAVWPGLVECTTGLVTLDRKKFQAQSPPVQVELIRRSLTHLGCGQRDLTRRHYEHILRLAKQNVTGRRIELPSGFVVRYEYGSVIVSRNYTMDCSADFDSSVKLEVPGKTKFCKYLIEATVCQIDEDELKSIDTLSHAARCLDCARYNKNGYVERFDLGKIKRPLSVRFRRDGDKFVPLGLSGEKKIGKFLTAQRVPYEVRKKVILLEDFEKIIWVWPIRISERVKVTTDTRQILQLRITYSSGA